MSKATFIGDINYSLHDLKIGNFNVPISDLETVAGHGVIVTVAGVDADITMAWSYKEVAWPHIGDSGTAEIDVKSLKVFVLCVPYMAMV